MGSPKTRGGSTKELVPASLKMPPSKKLSNQNVPHKRVTSTKSVTSQLSLTLKDSIKEEESEECHSLDSVSDTNSLSAHVSEPASPVKRLKIPFVRTKASDESIELNSLS